MGNSIHLNISEELEQINQTAPRAFISYAHYDSDNNHRPVVFRLCERLRENGVDCWLDQFEENDPPADWPRWMLQQLTKADYVLVVCTETYRRRFEGKEAKGVGLGATWEGGAITADIYQSGGGKHRFIPVTLGRRSEMARHVPPPLDVTTSYDVTSDADIDRLLRRIHESPEVAVPPLGEKPDFSQLVAICVNPRDVVYEEFQEILAKSDHGVALQQAIRRVVEGFRECILKKDLDNATMPDETTYRARILAYEECCAPLASAMALTAFYGRGEDLRHLSETIEAIFAKGNSWGELSGYPAMTCLYAAGTAALAARNYDALAALILHPKGYLPNTERRIRIAERVSIPYVLSKESAKWLDQPIERAYFPGSEWMVRRLPPILANLIPETEVELAFDRFEHFLSLVLFELSGQRHVFAGRFAYKFANYSHVENPITDIILDGLEQGLKWEAIKAGFFAQEPSEARGVFDKHYEEAQKRIQW